MFVQISCGSVFAEDFKATDNYLQDMAIETKPTVMLRIVLIKSDLDVEKAYKVALQIAKEFDAVFQGMNVFTLANKGDFQDVSFIVDVDVVNKIIEKVKEGLNIETTDLRYQIFPATRPKSKPPQLMAT